MSCVQTHTKCLHWLLLCNGTEPMSAYQLKEAWREHFGTELKLWTLGMKNANEMSKLFAQFPDAFINKDGKHTAKEISRGNEFTPRTDKVMNFLYARYKEYYKSNRRAGEMEYVEPPSKRLKTETTSRTASPKRSPSEKPQEQQEEEYEYEEKSKSPEVDDMDPEMKKKYLVSGAKIIFEGGRIGKISSAFPYLNQYWIEDDQGNVIMDEPTNDNNMPGNRAFKLEELRIPEGLSLEESWDRDVLPNAILGIDSLCQVRTLQDDDRQPNWLDATILNVISGPDAGTTMYQVRIHPTDKAAGLNYANRIGNNVPSHFVRWAPDKKKAAQAIAQFIDLETQAMHDDRTYDLDKANQCYMKAGIKLALAEQHLSQTDGDYAVIKTHRLEIAKRVQYLRRCLETGKSPDKKLEDFVNPVKLNLELHDMIIVARTQQNSDGTFRQESTTLPYGY